MAMRISRRATTMTCLVLLQVAVLAGLGLLLLNQQRLQAHIDPFDPKVIEAVTTTQIDQGSRLSNVETRLTDPASEQQLARLQQLQDETTRQLQALESWRAEGDALYALINERLDSVEREVTTLKELHAKPASAAAVVAPNDAIRPIRKRATPVVLPFAFIGIETRADESFAVIAPNDSFRLDQVQLLKSGEFYQDWQLLRIEAADKAVFISNGHERIVTLR